jgi:AcrR family transcriptional regulator
MNHRRSTGQARLLAKHQAEERSIERAAYRLVSRNDSVATGLQDILVETGLSTRAFYRHFASKDELLTAMYRAEGQRVAEGLSEEIATTTDPREAVRAWINFWIAVVYGKPRGRYARMLASAEVRGAAGFRVAQSENNLVFVAILAQVLSAGKHTATFPLVEPREDARAFQAAVVALMETRLFGHSAPNAKSAGAHLTSYISRALGCSLEAHEPGKFDVTEAGRND